MSELKAILWDHDGTLVETEPYWIAAEMELAGLHNAVWTEDDALACVGSPMRESARRIQAAGVRMDIDPIVDWLVDRVGEMMDEHGILWMPGVQELFAECAAQNIPCAVVSNAWRSVVEKTISRLPDGVVKFVLAGDEMVMAKPDPWPYAHAAEVLGVAPENCIAVEDSLAGTLSAEAAGIPVLVVKGVLPVAAGPNRSRVVDLSDINLDRLRDIVAGTQLELAEAFD